MKLYLAERHLALDAREREAFAQSYLGLVREGDVSEEAKEQTRWSMRLCFALPATAQSKMTVGWTLPLRRLCPSF